VISRWGFRGQELVNGVRFLLFLALSVVLPISTSAQRAEDVAAVPSQHGQLPVRDLFVMPRLPFYLQLAPSPDGRLMAYAVETIRIRGPKNVKDPSAVEERSTELWITNLASGKIETVCCEDAEAELPSWSPDGKYLAFYKVKRSAESTSVGGEIDELAVWDPETKTRREYLKDVLAPPIALTPPLWLADNKTLLIFTQPTVQVIEGKQSERQEKAGSHEAHPSGDPTVHVAMTPSFVSHDAAADSSADRELNMEYVVHHRRDVTSLDIVSGKFKLISKSIVPTAVLLSPDRKTLFYSTMKAQKRNTFYVVSDIHALNLATSQDRDIFLGATTYAGFIKLSCSPTGQFLAFPDVARSDISKDEQLTDFVLVDSAGGLPIRMRADFPDRLAAGDRAIWSKDGRWVSFLRGNSLETWDTQTAKQVSRISIGGKKLWDMISTRSDHTLEAAGTGYSIIVSVQDLESLQEGFWRIWPASHRTERLLEDDQTIPQTGPASYQELLPDGSQIFFVRQSAERPAELFEAESDMREIRQVTHLSSALDAATLGHTEVFRWLDNDGNDLKGVLLLPGSYESGRRYPLVVVVYPNPDTPAAWIHRFGMATAVNMQLLATRGYAVLLTGARISPNTRMLDVAKGVLPGIQKLIQVGIADPQRIGVMGQSDGGYATLALLVQSHIFRAAVVTSGWGNIINLESYEQGRRILRESNNFTATAWENRSVAIENSPYFYLDRVQTPILMTHGSMDLTVPESLSKEIFTALQDLGKEAVYVEYEGEGHVPVAYSLAHQIDLTNRIIDWWGRFLMQRDN
jgi:dipeptidyl aminopeptidase/acylaminoacyl peptidase